MLRLSTTTDKIQVILGGAITTNQLDCVATYKDINVSAAYTASAPSLVATNGSTAVDLVGSPASDTQRFVDFISVFNTDTANATVTIRLNRNGVLGVLFRCVLGVGELISYTEGQGWGVYQNNGSIKNAVTTVPDGSITANRNYLNNPNFAVIQGTASGTLANSLALPTASLGYLGETEWCIAASGGTPAYAFSAVGERVTFTGAASTTAIYLLQRLESRDVVTLANKLATVTFSAEISNSLLTSVIWEVFRPTTTADTHGTIGTPTQTLIASGTFTVNSTLTRYSATFTLPALASRGLEIRLRVGAQTSGTWVVARLQLEEGGVATDFSCGEYSEELQRCQRYFETSYPSGATIGGSSAVSGMGGISLNAADFYTSYTPTPFGVKKRSTPTMTGYSMTGALNVLYNLSLGIDQGNLGFRFVSDFGFCVFCSNSAMSTANAFGAHFTASAHIP